MTAIKLVIFDLDGTLVNAYPAITRSFNYTMRALGYPRRSALLIRRAVGWGDVFLLKPFVQEKDLKKAIRIYRRHHAVALRRFSRLLPQVDRTLAYLKKKKYRLAIASNRPTRFARIIVRHLALDRFIDYVLCADTLRYGKPHPEILYTIMRKYALGGHQTLYVGDMGLDAQTARRAKVKAVIVTTGSGTTWEIKKETPWKVVSSISALTEFL